MIIRKASKKDIFLLKQIWIKSKYAQTSDKKMDKALKRSLRYSETYIVEEKNKPIAYFVIENKKGITYLAYVAIIKSEQGKGFGTKIMTKIILLAKKSKSKNKLIIIFFKIF